jgi:hypothetical protein
MCDMTNDPVRRWLTSAAVTGSLAVLAIFALPGTAVAHGAEGLQDSDYRVTITSEPQLPGVTVRVVEAGARLELVNEGAHHVEILGYSGEPYAELRPDGLFLNTSSPATYLNESSTGATKVPSAASAAAPPNWVKGSDIAAIRWHDHRAHWMGASLPPVVAADPAHDHRVLDWTIPLRAGTGEYAVSGTLDWVAPPSTASWLAAALLLAAALTTVAVKLSDRRGVKAGLAAAAGLAGAAAVTDAVGRCLVAADLQYSWIQLLVLHQLWPAVAGVAGLIAAGYALARRPGADLAVGLAGVFVALLAGLTRFTSLTRAVTATPWDGHWARLTTVVALGIGAGLAVCCLARFMPAEREPE